MFSVKSLYQVPNRKVITAHRGFSGRYPENTLLAFEEAIQIGADIIEFDVRETADGELVIMHDSSVDRTTNGTGNVSELLYQDLQSLNASYWLGPHDTGKRLSTPEYKTMAIPTLNEALEYLHSRDIGINIQVYVNTAQARGKICELYQHFSLYEKAFLMIASFSEATLIKKVNPKIEICVGEDRDNLQRHKEFGSSFIQPWKSYVTPEFCFKIKELGLFANLFYSNTAEENQKYLELGMQGIMTDCPDLLIQSIKTFNKS